MRQRLLFLLIAIALLLAPVWAQGQGLIYQDSQVEQLGPGLELRQIRRYYPNGWQMLYILRAHLDEPSLVVDTLLANDQLTSLKNLENMAQDKGAAAAINGDFFFIGGTGAPVGFTAAQGEIVKSPSVQFPRPSIAYGHNIGQMGLWQWRGSLVTKTGEYSLHGYNESTFPTDAIVVYDGNWGGTSPGKYSPNTGQARDLVEVLIINDQVVDQRKNQAGIPIPLNGLVLTGRESGAQFLASLDPGEKVEINWDISPSFPYLGAISGFNFLVKDGQLTHDYPASLRGVHPRTAVGLDVTGRVLTMIVVDGRNPYQRGMTMEELANFMLDIGIWQGLNLDGGGSSTMVARRPGQKASALVNTPAGGMRRIPNAIGVFYPPPQEQVRRLKLTTTLPQKELGDNQKLIPSATIPIPVNGRRSFRVIGLDPYNHPIDLEASMVLWSVNPQELGHFLEPGIFQGLNPGTGLIHASYQAQGRQINQVLPIMVGNQITKLTSSPEIINILPGQSQRVQIQGWDSHGYPILLENADIAWEVAQELGNMDEGIFSGTRQNGGMIRANFADLHVDIPVELGHNSLALTTDYWKTAPHPVGSTEVNLILDIPELSGVSHGIGLHYAFNSPAPTRAAYLVPAQPITIPEEALALGMWVWGSEGHSHWLRGQVSDQEGQTAPIDFSGQVDWSGWKYVQGSLPRNLKHPLVLERIYLVTIQPNDISSGRMYFADLRALYPEKTAKGTIPYSSASMEEGFRFLVFGNTNIEVGVNTPSRLYLRKLAREGGDLAFSMGNLVKNSSAINYRSALRELSVFPTKYHLVPGKNDLSDNWSTYVGPRYKAFNHQDNLFILLDTSRGGLTNSDPAQWTWLRSQLRSSNASRAFILTSIPPFHPAGQGFGDQLEGSLLHEILVGHQQRTNQEIWVISNSEDGYWQEKWSGIQYLSSSTLADHHYLDFHVNDQGVAVYLPDLR